MAEVSPEASEWLWMHHPETGGTQQSQRAAFEIFHKPKGWVEIDPAAAQAGSVLDKPVADLNALSVAELKTVANTTGKETAGVEKKDDLVALVKDAAAKPGQEA